MSRTSRALGHVFGQRRRYAVVGVLTYRGPMTVGGIAILVRTPAFIVRWDLAKLQRVRVVEVIDADERKPYYRLAAEPERPEGEQHDSSQPAAPDPTSAFQRVAAYTAAMDRQAPSGWRCAAPYAPDVALTSDDLHEIFGDGK
jgi:hypothetical protein